MKTEFSSLKIIKYLEKKDTLLYSQIRQLYDVCEKILGDIPKTFSNYTLHDIDHSIRVIKYMSDFIPEESFEKFSNLHLGIIVYAGLMHDLGMFVSDGEAKQLYEQFHTSVPEFNKYTDAERVEYLREYIRKQHAERVRCIININYNPNAVIKNLLMIPNTTYDISDVITSICQSHCEDMEWIVHNIDNNEMIAEYEINPQHIAVLLRIADVLDIDDRRTPWVLYKLLNPTGRSEIEWKQHYPVSNYDKIKSLGDNQYQIVFTGKCSDPKIHRKISDYIDWINMEVKLVNSVTKQFRAPYSFSIIEPIENSIKPIGFESSSLKFSLSYEQITHLLMGENIYGNKKYGLRELLQNSIDAVKLMRQIREREKAPIPFQPSIHILLNKDLNRVTITDNGVGMSKNILYKYFFTIGNSFYVSDEYRENNYGYSPIGRYGIGFLSCFMLSSEICMETKHYESGDAYKVIFERDSQYVCLSNILSTDFNLAHGTKIHLNYSELFTIFENEDDIIKFIKDYFLLSDIICTVEGSSKYTFTQKDTPFNNCSKTIYGDGIELAMSYSSLYDFLYDINQITPNTAFYCVEDYKYNNIEIYNIDSLRTSLEELLEFFHEPDKYTSAYYGENPNNVNFEEIYLAMSENSNEFIVSQFNKLFKYYNDGRDIFEVIFSTIFNDCIIENELCWYDIPFVKDEGIFNTIISYMEKKSYRDMLKNYGSAIQYFSVFPANAESRSVLMDIVCDHFEINMPISYYDSYPFQPLLHRLKVLISKDRSLTLPYHTNYSFEKHNVKFKAYYKGIWVHDLSLSLPYVPFKFSPHELYVNILSNDYDINVARNDFSDQSKRRLEIEIGRLIFNTILDEKMMLNDVERALIKEFITLYDNEFCNK